MKIEILADTDAVAQAAAQFIAAQARAAVAARGRFTMAISGGRTPQQMLRALARQDIPWEGLNVVQVDERVAPLGHPDRNLTQLREDLLKHAPLRDEQIHPMPVESKDLDAAATTYGQQLSAIADSPPILDLVHLGLGPDGHTASLVPGDPALEILDSHVAVTGTYQNRRRMTLTFPILNRARRILWIITGSEKTEMLARLLDGDRSIPAGRVNRDHALVLADGPAAGKRDPCRCEGC